LFMPMRRAHAPIWSLPPQNKRHYCR